MICHHRKQNRLKQLKKKKEKKKEKHDHVFSCVVCNDFWWLTSCLGSIYSLFLKVWDQQIQHRVKGSATDHLRKAELCAGSIMSGLPGGPPHALLAPRRASPAWSSSKPLCARSLPRSQTTAHRPLPHPPPCAPAPAPAPAPPLPLPCLTSRCPSRPLRAHAVRPLQLWLTNPTELCPRAGG